MQISKYNDDSCIAINHVRARNEWIPFPFPCGRILNSTAISSIRRSSEVASQLRLRLQPNKRERQQSRADSSPIHKKTRSRGGGSKLLQLDKRPVISIRPCRPRP